MVSIHAPRVGRDANANFVFSNLTGFNPRAPRGARRERLGDSNAGFHVSIHAPRVGRDFDARTQVGRDLFQSTRPAWGATSTAAAAPSIFSSFNPRAPRGARPAE